MIPFSQRLIRELNRLYKAWLRFLWRLYGRQSPIVLMIHGFKPSKEECKSAFEMTCDSFGRMLEYLLNDGWHAMKWEELLEMVERRNWKDQCFYITFDDIYDTVYTEAYPVLKELQVPFTAFVTRDLVGRSGYVTMDHLKELSKDSLCHIGVHGIEHKVFRYLDPKEVEEQCRGDREWLEKQLGIKTDAFAFPYGRIVEVSIQNRKQLRKMGFALSFSALEGTLRASWFTSKWFLPRVNMSERFVERFTSGGFPRFKECEGR